MGLSLSLHRWYFNLNRVLHTLEPLSLVCAMISALIVSLCAHFNSVWLWGNILCCGWTGEFFFFGLLVWGLLVCHVRVGHVRVGLGFGGMFGLHHN